MVYKHAFTEWDKRWIGMAKYVSTFSKDPSSQVGAVIVKGKREISFGFNGFPECIPDNPEWYNDRELKLKLVIHAEQNALDKVERRSDLVGASIYVFPYAPCGGCCKSIVASGISRIIGGNLRKISIQESEFVISHCDPQPWYMWYDPTDF